MESKSLQGSVILGIGRRLRLILFYAFRHYSRSSPFLIRAVVGIR